MRVQRHTSGSVRYDKRRKTWNFLWYDGGTRRSKRIGTKAEFPTKASAWLEVERLQVRQPKTQTGVTVREVVTRYEEERTAALLDTCSPNTLARFTGYDTGFVVAVVWNLREDQRCKEGKYDFGKWLTSKGEVKEDEFWGDIDIAAGYTLSAERLGEPERICAEKIYWSLHPDTEYDFG